MKFFYLTILVSVFSYQALFCQHKIADIRVSASYNNASLIEIFTDISDRYQLNFSYSESLLPQNTSISYSIADQPLTQFLERILEGAGVDFKIIKQQIVIYPISDNKDYILSGFVRDSANSEGIAGVFILTSDKTGAVTNSDGYYSFRLIKGKHIIKFFFVGYATKTKEITIAENHTLNIELSESITLLKEVKVNNDLKTEQFVSTLGSIERVDIKTLRKIPNLLGEPDIIRTLSFLPGVTSNELSLGEFNIRGGASNQTIFQLDEAPIPNISHFGGILSIYNPDIVKQVNVSKGNFTASEKGALSAVIDVKIKEGNKKEWIMNGGVGTIFTRCAIEGPIFKEKTSLILAVRRTYIDQILQLFSSEPGNFQLNDLNLKIDHRFNWKNNLSITTFYGNDLIGNEDVISTENMNGVIKWIHFFNQRFVMENKLIAGSSSFNSEGNTKPELFTLKMQQKNFQFHNNYVLYLNNKAKISAGYQAFWTEIIPLKIESTSNESILKDFSLHNEKIFEQSIFLESDLVMFNRLAINCGIRFTYYMQPGPYRKYNYANNNTLSVTDTTFYGSNDIVYKYFSPEPRISMKYILNTSSSLKASYTRGTSFTHKLLLSSVVLPVSRFIPASALFPPEKSDNYSIGYFKNILNSKINSSVELFYRQMNNMVENRQNYRLLFADSPEKFINSAKGKAYGIEMATSGNMENIDFILSYTFSHARYISEEINSNQPYPPLFDINHAVSAFVSMKLGRRFELGLNWTYQSGLPYTEPTGVYSVDERLILQFDEDRINTKRLPPYHRMDLSLNFMPLKNNRRKWKSSWNLSVYNLYARKNPLGVVYFVEDGENTKTMNPSEQWKPRYIYFYQFVPSITYNFKF